MITAQCLGSYALYACSNASGTTCTKVLVNMVVWQNAAPCSASQFPVYGSQSDFAAVASAVDGEAAQNTAISALQSGGGSGGATAAQVATLQTAVTADQTAVASLSSQVSALTSSMSVNSLASLVSPADVGFVFSWGCAAVLGLYFLGYIASAAMAAVKRL